MKTVTIPFNSLYRDELWSDIGEYLMKNVDGVLSSWAESCNDSIANRVRMETFHYTKRVIGLFAEEKDVASDDREVFYTLYYLTTKQTEEEFRAVLERVLLSVKEPLQLGKIYLPAMIDENTEIVIEEV